MKQKIYLKDIKPEFQEHFLIPDMKIAAFIPACDSNLFFSILKAPRNKYYESRYEVLGPYSDFAEHFASIEQVKDFIKQEVNSHA